MQGCVERGRGGGSKKQTNKTYDQIDVLVELVVDVVDVLEELYSQRAGMVITHHCHFTTP